MTDEIAKAAKRIAETGLSPEALGRMMGFHEGGYVSGPIEGRVPVRLSPGVCMFGVPDEATRVRLTEALQKVNGPIPGGDVIVVSADRMEEFQRTMARASDRMLFDMIAKGFGKTEMLFESAPCVGHSTPLSARETLTGLTRHLQHLGYSVGWRWRDGLPPRRGVSKRRYRRLRGRLKGRK